MQTNTRLSDRITGKLRLDPSTFVPSDGSLMIDLYLDGTFVDSVCVAYSNLEWLTNIYNGQEKYGK